MFSSSCLSTCVTKDYGHLVRTIEALFVLTPVAFEGLRVDM